MDYPPASSVFLVFYNSVPPNFSIIIQYVSFVKGDRFSGIGVFRGTDSAMKGTDSAGYAQGIQGDRFSAALYPSGGHWFDTIVPPTESRYDPIRWKPKNQTYCRFFQMMILIK